MGFRRAFLAVLALASTTFAACDGSEDANVERHPTRFDETGDASADEGSTTTDAGPTGAAPTDASDGELDASPPIGPLFAFVGSAGDGKIRAYRVDETGGTWSLLEETTVGGNPSFLAFGPSRHRVVATDENNAKVRSFTFDSTTGGLTLVNEVSSGGAGPTHLSLDPTGAWVMVANYTGGSMGVLPIDAQGTIGQMKSFQLPGPKTHWAGTDPSGTNILATSLGANVVQGYTFNATTGQVTAGGTAGLPANAGPRHLAFSQDQKHVYSVNELATTVSMFEYDKSTAKLEEKQNLSALPQGTSTKGVSGAEIAMHPSGKFLFASTRAYNSVATFSVDTNNGLLLYRSSAPTGGAQPRSFAIDDRGVFLFAGNEAQNAVVGFRIDATSGALSSLGKTIDVTTPTFVGLSRFPSP